MDFWYSSFETLKSIEDSNESSGVDSDQLDKGIWSKIFSKVFGLGKKAPKSSASSSVSPSIPGPKIKTGYIRDKSKSPDTKKIDKDVMDLRDQRTIAINPNYVSDLEKEALKQKKSTPKETPKSVRRNIKVDSKKANKDVMALIHDMYNRIPTNQSQREFYERELKRQKIIRELKKF